MNEPSVHGRHSRQERRAHGAAEAAMKEKVPPI